MWPTSAAGRAHALRWLFFLSGHVTPAAADLARNRIAVKFFGGKPDEDAIARGEKALPKVIRIVEGELGKSKWLLGNDFTLVDCAYAPILNITEKVGFSSGSPEGARVHGRDPLASRMAGNSQASGPLD